jgi:alpha-N-arabinofuranosidase
MRKLILLIFMPVSLLAQQSTFLNPIIPGGHPDPSICRVGDDYYIVNSTFEYFPALPIHHSKDLVNWELIGYGLHREEQGSGVVNLVDVQQNGGIHAPSIRHHMGTYYIIVTNVYSPPDGGPGEMVNFIITASDPAGPWSDPHVIEGAPGIDPDIFFDDDGTVYFVGTHDTGNPDQNGIGEIWVQELDLNTWKLMGERHSVWRGACGGCCVEGPHIYKVDGIYYLLVAEGGTSHNHAVMIAASEEISGPYESNPRNPILTSRHLSNYNWVHSTGHADLVELPDGRWYMVALGIRNDVDGASNMGRETHLMPVTWEPATVRWVEVSPGNWEPLEYMWPVVAPKTGRVERNTPLPFNDKPQFYNDAFTDNFDAASLHPEWNFRRIPKQGIYSLSSRKGFLRLNADESSIVPRGQYAFVGFRQKESEFEYTMKMEFSPKKERQEAGLAIIQNDDNYLTFTVIRNKRAHMLSLVHKPRNGEKQVVYQEKLDAYDGAIALKVIAGRERYEYLYSLDGQDFNTFTTTSNDLVICRGYIGTNLGVYATGNGTAGTYMDVDWLSYKGFPRH